MAKRLFEFVGGTSKKFWAIDCAGDAFTVTYGRIGTAGTVQTKRFESPEKAQAAADKLIAQKTKEGYIEKPPAAPPPSDSASPPAPGAASAGNPGGNPGAEANPGASLPAAPVTGPYDVKVTEPLTKAWTSTGGRDLFQALLQSPLPQKVELAQVVRPAIGLEYTGAGRDSLPLGASHLGGDADLPPEIEWPRWKRKRLSLIAQINLSDLSRVPGLLPLPATGWLYFFYGIETDDDNVFPGDGAAAPFAAAPVLYSNAKLETLRRVPKCLTEEEEEYIDFHAVKPVIVDSMPVPEWPTVERILGSKDYDDQKPLYDVLFPENYRREHPIQMVTYAEPMQESINESAEERQSGGGAAEGHEEEFRLRAEQWVALYQGIDQMGECSIYYMMRLDDLIHQRWQRCCTVVQAT